MNKLVRNIEHIFYPLFLSIVGIAEILYLVIDWTGMELTHRLVMIIAFTMILHAVEEEFFPGGFGFSFNIMKAPKEYTRGFPMNPVLSMGINSTAVILVFGSAVLFPNVYPLTIAAALLWILETFSHTAVALIVGKKKAIPFYSPGMASVLLVGLPSSITYLTILKRSGAASTFDWVLGAVWIVAFFAIFVITPENLLAKKTSVFPFETDREFYGVFHKYIKAKNRIS